uniref:Uncharacterized protein n=1 Tax=Avena sativa TaxID=4498 RepID=A0ACD5VJ89_AVESA
MICILVLLFLFSVVYVNSCVVYVHACMSYHVLTSLGSIGSKPRAQWNMGLQKSLVDILHEHNNDYHRAQNGWSGDTWNLMTKIFKDRNKHVNFTKSQLQDQEKELKRQYCMLKEARKQSGAGWCEKSCRI